MDLKYSKIWKEYGKYIDNCYAEANAFVHEHMGLDSDAVVNIIFEHMLQDWGKRMKFDGFMLAD